MYTQNPIEAIVTSLTSIHKTPKIDWAQQIKVKRAVIKPVAQMCKRWQSYKKDNDDEKRTSILTEFLVNC